MSYKGKVHHINYYQWDAALAGRNHSRRKVGNNTYAERRVETVGVNGHARHVRSIAIKLHNTDVVTYREDGSIVLNSGGWKTSTTKDRINEHSPVRLSQHKGVWTFGYGSLVHTFKDGVTLKPDGTVEGAAVASDEDKEKKLRKQIAKFGQLVSESLPLPLPGAGDCLFCQCKTDKGEDVGGIEHLQTHLDEGYLVPSLVWNALRHAGCDPQGAGSFWFSKAFGEKTTIGDNGQIKRFVVKYLKRRFGLA